MSKLPAIHNNFKALDVSKGIFGGGLALKPKGFNKKLSSNSHLFNLYQSTHFSSDYYSQIIIHRSKVKHFTTTIKMHRHILKRILSLSNIKISITADISFGFHHLLNWLKCLPELTLTSLTWSRAIKEESIMSFPRLKNLSMVWIYSQGLVNHIPRINKLLSLKLNLPNDDPKVPLSLEFSRKCMLV